jgi:hypothetical protein
VAMAPAAAPRAPAARAGADRAAARWLRGGPAARPQPTCRRQAGSARRSPPAVARSP